MEISDEAVEAAARAEFEHEFRGSPAKWELMSDETRIRYRIRASNALVAAAPHLLKDKRDLTEVEKANRDHPERMAEARRKLREGARQWRRIERKQVEAKALIEAAKRLQQANPANPVMWLRDQGKSLQIEARNEMPPE
jgi:hypothetical protein